MGENRHADLLERLERIAVQVARASGVEVVEINDLGDTDNDYRLDRSLGGLPYF